MSAALPPEGAHCAIRRAKRVAAALVRLPGSALVALIAAYRFLLSPWIGNQCRFHPTCSYYAEEAIETHGALVGSYLGVRRLLRCHPWCDGGLDPVPERRVRAR